MRSLLAILCVFGACASPHTVSNYDIESYAGQWYQIANYPQFYEKFSCIDCTTATYTLNNDKTITVANSCRKSPTSSENSTVHAKATIPDSSEPGKLKVVFGGFFPAQYWILALGPKNSEDQYSWALVSNEKGNSAFILARTPTITSDVQSSVFQAMAKNQLDSSTLRFTTQKGCWGGEETTLKNPTVGSSASLHASCKLTFNFPKTDCNSVINALSVAAKGMEGLSGCGKRFPPADNFCGYLETGRTANSWNGTHTTANGKYKDDLTFTMTPAESGCTAAAYSTSETWYAVLDSSVNYCNLHNLVGDTNLTNTETDVSDHTCTQYSSRNCNRY